MKSEIKILCESFQEQLAEGIPSEVEELPLIVKEYYLHGSESLLTKLLERYGTGCSLYWVSSKAIDKYRWYTYDETKQEHPTLYLILQKCQIVKKILLIITDNKNTDATLASMIMDFLDEEKRDCLTRKPQSDYGKSFLKKLTSVLKTAVEGKKMEKVIEEHYRRSSFFNIRVLKPELKKPDLANEFYL